MRHSAGCPTCLTHARCAGGCAVLAAKHDLDLYWPLSHCLLRTTCRSGSTKHPRYCARAPRPALLMHGQVLCILHGRATPLAGPASFFPCSVLQLLAELSAYAPSVLGQQAADVPAADAAQWLKWWKDPRSWSAGYTFQQWLQVGECGAAEGMPHGVSPLCCAYAAQWAGTWTHGQSQRRDMQGLVWGTRAVQALAVCPSVCGLY